MLDTAKLRAGVLRRNTEYGPAHDIANAETLMMSDLAAATQKGPLADKPAPGGF